MPRLNYEAWAARLAEVANSNDPDRCVEITPEEYVQVLRLNAELLNVHLQRLVPPAKLGTKVTVVVLPEQTLGSLVLDFRHLHQEDDPHE